MEIEGWHSRTYIRYNEINFHIFYGIGSELQILTTGSIEKKTNLLNGISPREK